MYHYWFCFYQVWLMLEMLLFWIQDADSLIPLDNVLNAQQDSIRILKEYANLLTTIVKRMKLKMEHVLLAMMDFLLFKIHVCLRLKSMRWLDWPICLLIAIKLGITEYVKSAQQVSILMQTVFANKYLILVQILISIQLNVLDVIPDINWIQKMNALSIPKLLAIQDVSNSKVVNVFNVQSVITSIQITNVKLFLQPVKILIQLILDVNNVIVDIL